MDAGSRPAWRGSVQKGSEPVSTAHPAAVHGPSAFAARSVGRLAGAAGLLLFAVATGVALSKHPLPLTLVLAFGVGLLGTLALVLARYDAAVALGGQVAGRITEVRPVADIIRECATDCLAILRDLAAKYPGP